MLASVLLYGLINSFVLALIAVGFSLTYGISRLANFAHGALYVLAGFTAWALIFRVGLNPHLAMALTVLTTAALGAALYRFVLIRVRGQPIAEIIVTFALGLAALEALRFAGFVGSSYSLPAFRAGTVELAGVPVDVQRLVIVAVGVLLVVGLRAFARHTRTGLALRAIAQDEGAAMMVGIDSDGAATLAVALGAGLAAVAAVTILPLGFIAVESGPTVLIYAIAVSILGGLESVVGLAVASLLIGYAQILSVHLLGPHYQMIVALLAILVTLILKPSGLFGSQKELEERV
jgi:branched-chain amino acid transport system permease protein